MIKLLNLLQRSENMPRWAKILLIPTVISMMILVGVESAQGEKDLHYNIEQSLVPLYKRCYATLRLPTSDQATDSLLRGAKAVGDERAYVMGLYLKGEHYYFTRQNVKLKAVYEQLENYARHTPYTIYIFALRNRIVTLYVYDNDYMAAMRELHEYQRLAFELNDDYGKVYCLRMMGDVYRQQRDFRNAARCYNDAISRLSPGKGVQRIDDLYLPLGAAYLDMGEYGNAEDTYRKTYNMVAKANVGNQPLSKVLSYLIIVDCRKGDIESATKKIQLQDSLLNGAAPESGSWDIYYWARGEYYYNHKEYDKCIAACDSAKNQSLLLKFRRKAYAGMGDYEKAYQLAERDLVSTDSVNQNQIKNQVDLYAFQSEKDRLEIERNRLAVANYAIAMEKMKVEKNLLVAGKEKDSLRLRNSKLELRNKNLYIQRQKNENMRKEQVLRYSQRELKSRQEMNALIIGASVLAILFLVLFLLRRRSAMKKIEKEKREAQAARHTAEQAQARAEAADRIKSLFLQNMSHEIRTPLNAIVGFTELLNNGEVELDESEKAEYIGLVRNNTELLMTLINDILDMSELESGTYEMKWSDVNVKELCQRRLLSVQDRVRPGVELRLEACDEGLELRTDETRLSQVLTNLLVNASKFTEKGSITLGYKEEGGQVIFSVSDTGCGISPEKAEKVFARFEKLDKFKQGTGLGLNICRLIAQMVHGRIYVDTSYREGARFVFEHPKDAERHEE